MVRKPELIEVLETIVGKAHVLTAKEDLATYSYDGTTPWSHPPDVVVLPETTSQFSAILGLANKNLVPVTPRGSGTNISGGSIPVRGGIVLCTTRMNRVLDINRANLTATLEPGVVLQDFNRLLAKENLFHPPRCPMPAAAAAWPGSSAFFITTFPKRSPRRSPRASMRPGPTWSSRPARAASSSCSTPSRAWASRKR